MEVSGRTTQETKSSSYRGAELARKNNDFSANSAPLREKQYAGDLFHTLDLTLDILRRLHYFYRKVIRQLPYFLNKLKKEETHE